jgi:hypothetical protein
MEDLYTSEISVVVEPDDSDCSTSLQRKHRTNDVFVGVGVSRISYIFGAILRLLIWLLCSCSVNDILVLQK